jgi:tetratricopeptide (TPR) repeat protein
MTTRATKLCALLIAWTLAVPPALGGAVDPALQFLENRVRQDPLDFTAQNRLAGKYLDALRDSGDLAFLDRAAAAARASLASAPEDRNPGGLATLARVEFESHHFAEALAMAQRAYRIDPRNLSALALTGDAQLELGDYPEAKASYAKLVRSHKAAPPIVARQARLAELHGDNAKAIALLKSIPQQQAWFPLRLGEIYFRTGQLEPAEAQYQAALKLAPASAPALEHLAELRGAQARYDEAIALYQQAIGLAPRAEYLQALGDLYTFMGQPDAAKPWQQRALAAYLESVNRGNAHYLHHLAGFYSDVQENPAEALRWARKDMEIRHSLYAYDTLAWALYKNGEFGKARDAMQKALALGTKDAHLLYHAGLVYSRAGDLKRGQAFLKQAVAVNPYYNAFHAHR